MAMWMRRRPAMMACLVSWMSNELKVKGRYNVVNTLFLYDGTLCLQNLCWLTRLSECICFQSCTYDFKPISAVIKINHMNDSRRSYQCIKFLVNLTSKCSLAKDYLLQAPTKWQWAVNWLKKKVSIINISTFQIATKLRFVVIHFKCCMRKVTKWHLK